MGQITRADDRKTEASEEVFVGEKQERPWMGGRGRDSSKKGKGVLCQEKCANLMQLKQIFKEML